MMMRIDMDTILCSAFPGTGKSYFYQNHSPDLIVMDSDSSKFDKSHFPRNYLMHIKSNVGYANVICISSHKEVRDALVDMDMWFYLVYPEATLKDEYLERFKQRGDTVEFIELIASNWDNWLMELGNQDYCEHIVLQSGGFLQNVNWRK